jgi:hypothetical protein
MTLLTEMRQDMADYLAEQGINALEAWPREAHRAELSPVVLVQVEKIQGGPAGFQHYLGEFYSREEGQWLAWYGQRVKVTFALELYSPSRVGEEGCRELLDQVCLALQTGGPAGLTMESWTMEEPRFLSDSGLFRGKMTLVCSGVISAEETGGILFEDVVVKGRAEQ